MSTWNEFQSKTRGVFSNRGRAAQAYKATHGKSKLDFPDPKSYLDPSHVEQHLAMFDGGVSKITWGVNRPEIGPPAGHFVMPRTVADDLITKSGGNIPKLEKLLGLTPGELGDSPVRIDISNPQGLRMPTGREPGANEFWLPGGKTSGGIPEAVINQTPVGDASITNILKK
ncbi:hypothetical protein N5923_08825 [Erwiniaceae bacterium BAC15a-03b]|uniref:Uncharacterized protein n=1 Tax=Winslowiella arboricola TaxID=2978220 RepID=A0A9J6PJQ2_9GAMM|nr:hypothetical protein [Winslowiella arboricola]MCU5771735.1 hypothetical protein [Winslowiella arboricola]MCU5777594.1 hypothetical protein [Winslowiella arboricola]